MYDDIIIAFNMVLLVSRWNHYGSGKARRIKAGVKQIKN